MPAGVAFQTGVDVHLQRNPTRLNGARRMIGSAMAVLSVGPGQQYSTITAAVAAAQNGDTIQVQAGAYPDQYISIRKNITLQGIGGRVEIVSTRLIPNGKAIFITNGDITIENFAFSGARVANRNGAGIKEESGNLILNNCGFFNNEMGVLTGNTGLGSITVNNSEFAYNGVDSAYSPSIGHNLYVGRIESLTVNNSYFHEAKIGHEIKSRALDTTIINSRIYDLNGTASYSIDLPNGGNAVIQDNVIEQGPFSQNPIIITFGEEGNFNPGKNLFVSGNTILNDKGPLFSLAVRNMTTTTVQIIGNKFFGLSYHQIARGPNAQISNQFLITKPLLDTTHP